MVVVTEHLERVDLITADGALEELMLQYYPDPITEQQHHRDHSDPDIRLICFYDLWKPTLLPFLQHHGEPYLYEIRRSCDGAVVAVHPPYR